MGSFIVQAKNSIELHKKNDFHYHFQKQFVYKQIEL